MADSTALMRCPSAQHSARPQHGAKLVYLIRHAESRENVRVRAAGAVLSRLAALSLPRGQDLCAASRLLLCDLDAPLSDAGVEQVRRARERLGGADFLRREGIELVVHSSRQRTARTCRELFGQGPGPPVSAGGGQQCVQRPVAGGPRRTAEPPRGMAASRGEALRRRGGGISPRGPAARRPRVRQRQLVQGPPLRQGGVHAPCPRGGGSAQTARPPRAKSMGV
ncbi:unnamed protein product [Prorocentrum cordatum]|uniref:Phosphoglycerate mutase (2,3-diphosphoglycerate-dependent) n=1 Tax=Prorocentrum cordatum TaxID=2364126 RepID=A0ABN9UNN1_9DINO|nr:unnamed protein product [Polarella glacialis]